MLFLGLTSQSDVITNTWIYFAFSRDCFWESEVGWCGICAVKGLLEFWSLLLHAYWFFNSAICNTEKMYCVKFKFLNNFIPWIMNDFCTSLSIQMKNQWTRNIFLLYFHLLWLPPFCSESDGGNCINNINMILRVISWSIKYHYWIILILLMQMQTSINMLEKRIQYFSWYA